MTKKRQLVFLLTFLLTVCSLGLAGNALARTHMVSNGESLYQIARWYNTTPSTLQKANGLTNSVIYPGQVLWVPTYHFVATGESLYQISRKYGVPYSEIMKHNGLKTTTIYPGQKLYIPDNTTTYRNSTETVSRSWISRPSASDLDLLARLITAEADSESFITKVAVGAVVLNRVASKDFPNSITRVIYHVDETGRYQFEPVLNGWINRPASKESIRAAKEAIKGWDPTNGALYFWESWVKNKFLNSRPVSVILDAFTFTW